MLQVASEKVKTKWETFSLAPGHWEGDVLLYLDTILAHPTNYIGETRESVFNKLYSGAWQGWVVEGPRTKVLLLTLIITHFTGSELFIVGIAGRGLCFHFKRVLEEVEKIMKHFKCHFLQCHTADERMAKVLKRHKFVPLTTNFLRVRTEA